MTLNVTSFRAPRPGRPRVRHEQWIKIGAEVPLSFRDELDESCRTRGLAIAAVVRDAVGQWLAEHPPLAEPEAVPNDQPQLGDQ